MTTQKANNFAFFGTPALAVDILEALAAGGYVPSLIVTMPDRPQGRGMDMRETSVAAWARERGIEVLKPEKLDAEFVSNFKRDYSGCALSIVVAYGKILPQSLLDIAPMYNIHYSLLPRWRGATPVESAILAGDRETGVAIQRIVYQLDAGPIVGVKKTPIQDETAPMLRTRLNAIAAKLLISLMPRLMSGMVQETTQDESFATSCGKISKEDGAITLNDSAEENFRKFLAYFGWPGIYTYFERNGNRIRTIITKAHIDGSRFVIDTVKPEGKGEMSFDDFARSGARPL